MDITIEPPIEPLGFSSKKTGGHMARSMMHHEISTISRELPAEATPDDYKTAIITDNILGKPTFASRDKSYRHLTELVNLIPRKTDRSLVEVLSKGV